MSGNVPPSSRAGRARRGLTAAAKLFEQFTGHDAEVIGEIELPPNPPEIAIIGECAAICYDTVRDGRRESYIHEFSKRDRPVLAVTPNGRHLLLVGGRYVFTERGIVDMSDRKNLPARFKRKR